MLPQSTAIQLPLFPTEKRCGRCKEVRPLEQFGQRAAALDDLHPWCKDCMRRYARERYRREHPEPAPKPALRPDEKYCSSCRQVKQRSAFGTSRSEKDGLNGWCKECVRSRSLTRYRRLHPEARTAIITAEQRSQWRSEQRKRCAGCAAVLALADFGSWAFSSDGLMPYCRTCARQHNRARYHADLQASRERARQAYWADPDKYRQRQRKAYTLRPHVLRLRSRTQYLKHRAQRRAYAQAYRVRNRDAVVAYQRAWRQRNPVKIRAKNRGRDARKRAAPGRWTPQDITLIRDAQRGQCAYCRVPLGGTYHVEHMTPLSRGGSNWPWNLCVACDRCNSRKHVLCAGAFFALLLKEDRAKSALTQPCTGEGSSHRPARGNPVPR